MSKYASQIRKIDEVGECVMEGCDEPGNTIDHVLFGQQKKAGVAMKRWLNNAYNTQLVCLEHNIDHTANTYEARKKHVLRILEEEGWATFALWLSNCPSEKFVLKDNYQEICKVVNDFAEDVK